METDYAHNGEDLNNPRDVNLATRQNRGFEGQTIACEDGTSWKIIAPLSHPRKQLANPPFESTQVFTCVCANDPAGKYDEQQEAVMKVKYQIKGSPSIIREYEELVEEYELKATKTTNLEKAAQNLEIVRYRLHATTNPVEMPNQSGINEVQALQYLSLKKCTHTPHFLTYACERLEEGIDDEGIVGGYVFFIVMTKVPGEPLISTFTEMPASERDEVRRAFQEAICDVHSFNIDHDDPGLRNVLWDRNKRKCYIIDFEDHTIYRNPRKFMKEFEDWLYDMWELSESRYKGFKNFM